MKKLLILLTITLVFISCASYKPRLVEDKFYKDNSYFTTRDEMFGNYYGVGTALSYIGLSYKSKNGTSNVIIQAQYTSSSLIVVEKTDNIIIRYKDGSTSTLNYTSRVSDYQRGYGSYSGHFYIGAVSSVISEYKDMDMIRVVIDGTYQNIEVTDKNNKKLRKIFNDIQQAADDYYQ